MLWILGWTQMCSPSGPLDLPPQSCVLDDAPRAGLAVAAPQNHGGNTSMKPLAKAATPQVKTWPLRTRPLAIVWGDAKLEPLLGLG